MLDNDIPTSGVQPPVFDIHDKEFLITLREQALAFSGVGNERLWIYAYYALADSADRIFRMLEATKVEGMIVEMKEPA